MTNHYAVLGVAPTAGRAELDHAFRTLVRAYHPDTRTDTLDDNDQTLRHILTAYATLRDPATRAAYDATLTPTTSRSRRPSNPSAADEPLRIGPVRWQRPH